MQECLSIYDQRPVNVSFLEHRLIPALIIPTKLTPSACGAPKSVVARLARCKKLPLLFSLIKAGNTGEIGELVFVPLATNPLLSSTEVCIIEMRIQCLGNSVSARRLGQKYASKGFRAMSEAQTMPMLTSTADQVTA